MDSQVKSAIILGIATVISTIIGNIFLHFRTMKSESSSDITSGNTEAYGTIYIFNRIVWIIIATIFILWILSISLSNSIPYNDNIFRMTFFKYSNATAVLSIVLSYGWFQITLSRAINKLIQIQVIIFVGTLFPNTPNLDWGGIIIYFFVIVGIGALCFSVINWFRNF